MDRHFFFSKQLLKGLTGPAQVMTRITCERRGPNTELVINFFPQISSIFQLFVTHCFLQSLTIPVNIRVTDANDNSPVFRNATYSVNISEVYHFETTIRRANIQNSNSFEVDHGRVSRFTRYSSAGCGSTGTLFNRRVFGSSGTLFGKFI